MKATLATVLLSTLLFSGCASTADRSAPATSTSPLRAELAQDFVGDIDGAAVHPGTGLRCPADLLGIGRDRASLSRPDGSDMSCHCHEGSRFLTLFLSQVPGAFSRDDYDRIGYGGMRQAMRGRGLSVDADATDQCRTDSMTSDMMARQLMSGLLGASKAEGDTTIEVGGRDTLVMRGKDQVSVMLFDEVVPGQFLKLRYTGPDADDACAPLIEIFDARETEIRDAQGLGDPLSALKG